MYNKNAKALKLADENAFEFKWKRVRVQKKTFDTAFDHICHNIPLCLALHEIAFDLRSIVIQTCLHYYVLSLDGTVYAFLYVEYLIICSQCLSLRIAGESR